ELVRPEAIRFLRVPSQLAAPRAVVDGSDAVEPVIAADEVAAWPAEHGHAERANGIEHVLPETALVGERRALVEDAAVDAATEVLDEVPEDAPVDTPDPPAEVDADARHDAASLGSRVQCVNARHDPPTQPKL